jgi:Holliday junction resolvase-like predicted endonuclease
MADPRHRLGHDAEDAAARWLVGAGWVVLARRYRPAHGAEIDLVMLDPRRVLVAIEVRARRSRRSGAGEESVDAARVGRIGRSLARFASGSQVAHRGLRVDLVAAEPVRGPPPALRLRRLVGVGE